MNKKTKVIVWVLILVAVVISIVMNVKGNNEMQDSDGPITIGFVGPLTGNAVTYGEPISNAIRLAVDEINANGGGVNGRMIEVIYEDGKCAGKDAANAAQKLVNVDQVDAIIGGICSSESLAMVPITTPVNVLVLSPSSSSADLTEQGGEYFFRNNPSDADGGAFLADVVLEQHSRVAVISESTEYAQALRQVFVTQFESNGGEVVADESFTEGTSDFRSILTKVKAANPEAIFLNPQTEITGAALAKQIAELGVEGTLYGSNLFSGSKTLEVAGDAVEGIVMFDSPGLARADGNSVVADFISNYEARYGDLTLEFYLGAGYDAVYLLADAFRAAGTEDPVALRDYFRNINSFSGVVGTYSFDGNGDMYGINPVLKQVRNGEVVIIRESTAGAGEMNANENVAGDGDVPVQEIFLPAES